MALAPKLPVTPFLDPKTGMPSLAWHQYLASLGGTTASTVATPAASTTTGTTSVSSTASTSSVETIPTPSAPSFVALSPGAVIPKFRIRCPIPATGNASKLDVYYQSAPQASEINENGWIHLGSVGSVTGTPFTPSSNYDVEILNPAPTATGEQYFAIFTLSNSTATSNPSPISDGLIWPPTGQFLADPMNPVIMASLDSTGAVTKIRITTGFAPNMTEVPDGFAVMYSMTDVPNAVSIVADNGPDLTVGSTTIEATGTGTILAGSTVGEIVNTTSVSPNNTDFPLISKYWCQYGQSSWRKATGVTPTSFLFNPPFDVDPVAGETINWAEIAWFDDRGPDSGDTYGVPGESYRLGCLVSGTSYEVLSWSGVTNSSGIFHITGCVRGLEGTVPLNAAGLTMHYYPAPGQGTTIIPIPAASFTKSTDGTFQAQAEANIRLPAGWSMSVSCMTYKIVLGKIIRSDIVPLAYGGTF